jgi:DNA-binding transcriptional regulator PaaX
MAKKQDFSKKIIKILSEKPAISVSDIIEKITPKDTPGKPLYAIKRSLKGLEDSGLVEHIDSGRADYARLTKEGKKKAHSLKLESDTAVVNPNWDGFWRIIILDLPEERKSEREALRYLLKKAGFVAIKNSVWVSPHPFEHLFANIKKDLGLTTELMIIKTDSIDPETEKSFRSI